MIYQLTPEQAVEMKINTVAHLLDQIEQHDTDYERRYRLVLQLVLVARDAGFPAGFRIDPSEPEWPVATVELPTGQVSWHMPQHEQPWDGHDTATKYERCRTFAKPHLARMHPWKFGQPCQWCNPTHAIGVPGCSHCVNGWIIPEDQR